MRSFKNMKLCIPLTHKELHLLHVPLWSSHTNKAFSVHTPQLESLLDQSLSSTAFPLSYCTGIMIQSITAKVL